ncbi:GGDEF domain-containing protein [Piscinibacter sp. XHJ-5]|uniref:GGDEF domain-containing protein n=1 Tax=Piscinibacter sp. XHJ-5 TaxID=3037797 RepID=UPI0024530107|nr:GGDEF domain-containing protein [Piscinibacter sp. XHJ-5]
MPLRALLVAVCLACAGQCEAAATAASAASASAPAATLRARIAELEHEGDSRPRQAADALATLLLDTVPFGDERLEGLVVRGLLLASASEPEAADQVAQSLEEWARTRDSNAAAAAALLVRARALAQRGNLQKADALLSEAMARLPVGATPLMRLRYLQAHAKIKDDSGKLEDAARLLHEALTLADQVGAAWLRAEVRASLAYVFFEAKQLERANHLNAEALEIASRAQDFTAMGRVHNVQGILLDASGDTEGERREMQAAIGYARRGGAKSDESLYLANLADFYLKSGQYRTALTLSEQVLPLARELKDVGGETVALANIGLAHISMNKLELGKRYVDEAIQIDERRGSSTGVSATLAELGHYLEKAGDIAGAVTALHRHRQIADEILQRDQQKAIVELQERFDAERRAKDLALLNRENDLKSEQLRQRDLQQRLWWMLAAAFALSLVLLTLLYRRVRRSNRALESTNHQLLVQSERDPLTGLANRRHFQAAMKQLAADGKLSGTVFLIDIDHFKRINDAHGHSAGDTVLAEMARRLRETLREQDLIVRWGGEEFLVVVRTLPPEQVEALARRMLGAMAGTPVRYDRGAMEVTGSIGYATFPIEPTLLAVSWERAINLVDTAMYLAKAHGRNRAYGVRLLHARDETQLDEITRSLEGAWNEGQVALTLLQGPTSDMAVAA